MPHYAIVKVSRRYAGRCTVTREHTITTTADLAQVIALAEKQGADVNEMINELSTYGTTWQVPGYLIDEVPNFSR